VLEQILNKQKIYISSRSPRRFFYNSLLYTSLLTNLVLFPNTANNSSITNTEHHIEIAKQARKQYDTKIAKKERELKIEKEKENLKLTIENKLEEKKNSNQLRKDLSTSWIVYDIVKDEIILNINGEVSRSAASMIKPFIAIAYMHKVESGELKYSPAIKNRMIQMIKYSDNKRANEFMKELGGPKNIQRMLTEEYGDIFKQTNIVEYIPTDSLNNGRSYLNSASADDYCRFLNALWKNELPGSDTIKDIMGLPKKNRISENVPEIPKDTKVYDKTGTTAKVCGDMGIVVSVDEKGNEYPYIFVGLIESQLTYTIHQKQQKPLKKGNIIKEISGQTYKTMKTIQELNEL